MREKGERGPGGQLSGQKGGGLRADHVPGRGREVVEGRPLQCVQGFGGVGGRGRRAQYFIAVADGDPEGT